MAALHGWMTTCPCAGATKLRLRRRCANPACAAADLELVHEAVPDGDVEEVLPGWLNVLFPLKATADFGVDLRNHDPARTWDQRFADG